MSHAHSRSFVRNFIPLILLAALSFGAISCRSSDESTKHRQVATKPIQEVKTEHEERLMTIPGVSAVLVGEVAGKACIKVIVRRKNITTLREIPTSLGGYPVSVEEAGLFRTR